MPYHAPLASVKIAPDRQRQEFDPQALQELTDDIEANGLLHPPVVRQVGNEVFLVAGERRMKAISQIMELGGTFRHGDQIYPVDGTEIPLTLMSDLDELTAEEIELHENIKRRDLNWKELAAAHTRLHTLRQKQKQRDTKIALVAEGMPEEEATAVAALAKQSVSETAQEIHGRSDGWYQDSIRKDLILSKHLDNPAIAKAKDANEAFKILQKQERSADLQALAATVGATFSADKHIIINRDCLDFMREQVSLIATHPEEAYDVICTDPPYGMNAQDFGDAGGKMTGIEHHYDDSYDSWKKLMTEWCPLSYHVAKPQAHAYVFCDIDNFHELKGMMQAAGWYVFRTPLTIHKTDSGRVPLPTMGPRRQTEWCLYAIKGNKPTTHIYPDLIPCAADKNGNHGAQKPVALFENLLMRSAKPGDNVADFFGGSGPLLDAGHAIKCTVTIIEKNPEYYGMCLKRAADLKILETPGMF